MKTDDAEIVVVEVGKLRGDVGEGQTAVVELAPIAIFIDPADADLHAALGRALAATGKSAAAAVAFEHALYIEPREFRPCQPRPKCTQRTLNKAPEAR